MSKQNKIPGEPITPGHTAAQVAYLNNGISATRYGLPADGSHPTCDGDYNWLLLDLPMHERPAGLEPAISTSLSTNYGRFLPRLIKQ